MPMPQNQPSDTNVAGPELGLPPAPDGEYDRYGNWVDLTSQQILFHDPTSEQTVRGVDLSALTEEIGIALKHWLALSIKRHSPAESHNQGKEIILMLKAGGLPASLSEMNIEWWNGLRQHQRKLDAEYRLARPRAWFLWMADRDFPDVDIDVANTLEGWSIPGNVKGEAVKSADTERGPLTYNQFAHLHTKVAAAAQRGITTEVALVKLCMNLGQNGKNMALLEERDLTSRVDPKTGDKEYFLNVPRIKKRHAMRVTKNRHLLPETGAMLEALILLNRQKRGGSTVIEPGLMPIFCRDKPREFSQDSPFRGRFEWHYNTADLTALVEKFSKDNDLKTPGGSERFILTIRRLRYTFATRLAAQNAPETAIAEALDHSDLQSVKVYVNATGELVDRLDKTLGQHLQPWMEKFMTGPQGSIPADDPATIFHPDPHKFLGIGNCGLKSQCHVFPPLSCYSCDYFHPWVDADHESVLVMLEARKAELTENRADQADRIPHQLDGVIFHVKLRIAAKLKLKEAT